MKRKALVILTVAILAFAMIPAIGVGAATGEIKIVTPNEIVDPTNSREDDAFDQLESATYVSTAAGGESLEGTYGTLYAVIADNDADANALTPYTKVYTGTPATGNFLLSATGTVYPGIHVRPVPDGTSAVSDADAADLNIGDFTRNGLLNGDDIRVYLDYTPSGGVLTSARLTTIGAVISTGATINVSTLYEAPSELRLVFYSASTNTLLNSNGESRVQVRANADSINLLASEKDLTNYSATDDDGLNAMEFGAETAVSKDSGIFVGAFGLIAAEWKEMLDDWIELDGGENNTRNKTRVSKTALLCVDAHTAAAPDTDPVDRTGETPPGIDETTTPDGKCDDSDPDGDPIGLQPGFNTAKVPTDGDRGTAASRDVTITLAPADIDLDADQFIADRNEDGMVDHRDINVTYNNASGPGISVKSFRFVDASDPPVTQTNNVSGSNLLITVTLPSLTSTERTAAADPATIPANKRLSPLDTITITYATTADFDTLIDDIEATVEGSGDDANDHKGAFEDLAPNANPDNRESGRLVQALRDQERNMDALGAETSTSASILINRLLGVTHGSDISVRYTDASAGLQTKRASVDLVAPTVRAITPGNNSFTTDDRIDGFFSVTDVDAGIPEDAEDVGRNGVNAFTALPATARVPFVRAAATIDGETPSTADFDPERVREENAIDDGYTYEYRIDIPRTTVRNAESNNRDVEIKLTVTAYDRAGNRASTTLTFIIDLVPPELVTALTGWGAKSDSTVGRGDTAGTNGAYVLTQNGRDRIVLVFNSPIDGTSVDEADISVAGNSVAEALWLDNRGGNVISTLGEVPESQTTAAKAGQLVPGANVAEDVEDDEAGMNLSRNQLGQDARHLLFLRLSENLATDATPAIEIDRNDLQDLAGNEPDEDHEVQASSDRISPNFTVTLDAKYSSGDLGITIESSEELTRRGATATIQLGTKTVQLGEDRASDTSWTVSETLSSLRLNAQGGDDGLWTVRVTGVDEAGNMATNAKTKWELDTTANDRELPSRVGVDADDGTKAQSDITQELETNEIVFLNLSFSAEGGEYTGDTRKKVSISALTLDNLADNAISASTKKIVANTEPTATTELDIAVAQTSDGVKHVIALDNPSIGNHRLNVSFADEAGNTGKFAYVFTIIAPEPAEVSVVPGWSLISIPGAPQDTSISGVFTGSEVTEVWGLNNESKEWEYARKDENGEWMGNLVQITDGRGYFVRSGTFDPIKVLTQRFRPDRPPVQYVVTSGWNSIGYTAAGDEKAISVDGYLSSLGASGWGMVRMWNTAAIPPQYETYFSSGAMTAGFPTGDGHPAGAEGGDADNVANGVAKVEVGKGYLLFATRNGTIGG